MGKQLTGWIPYGSDDPSVLFRHALTSEVTTAAMPYSTRLLQGSGQLPTHHPTLGMKASDAAGAEASYRFTSPTATISSSSISDAGQLTFEVERAWVCQSNASGSSGYLPDATQSAFRVHTSGTATTLTVEKWTTGAFTAQNLGVFCHSNSFHDMILDSTDASNIHSDGKGEFVTVNLGWWGGRKDGILCLAVDGMILSAVPRVYSATSSGTWFDNLYLGSNFGTANTFVDGHYIRNFQLSARPPIFPTHPGLRSLAFLSDSLTDDLVPNTDPYDNAAKWAVRRYFHQLGFKIGGLNISENGGYSVGTTSTQLETKVATVLAFNPDVVVISGGTNDVGSASYSGTTFDTEYHDLLEQLFLGVAKTSRTTVQRVFCNIPPPRLDCVTDTAMAARHTDVRTRIALLPAWWNTTYGATYGSGRVQTIDIFGALGSNHSIMSDTSISGDGIHYAYRGNRIYGETVAKALHLALGS